MRIRCVLRLIGEEKLLEGDQKEELETSKASYGLPRCFWQWLLNAPQHLVKHLQGGMDTRRQNAASQL